MNHVCSLLLSILLPIGLMGQEAAKPDEISIKTTDDISILSTGKIVSLTEIFSLKKGFKYKIEIEGEMVPDYNNFSDDDCKAEILNSNFDCQVVLDTAGKIFQSNQLPNFNCEVSGKEDLVKGSSDKKHIQTEFVIETDTTKDRGISVTVRSRSAVTFSCKEKPYIRYYYFPVILKAGASILIKVIKDL